MQQLPSEINCYKITYDRKYCLMGHRKGFYFYQLKPFLQLIHIDKFGSIGVCEILRSTNIIFLAGSGESPLLNSKTMIMYDTIAKKVIKQINFKSQVMQIKVNDDIVAVQTKNKLIILSFKTMEIIKQNTNLLFTNKNPNPLIELSSQNNSKYIFTTIKEKGYFGIFQVIKHKFINSIEIKFIKKIKAHNQPIKIISLNPQEDLLATCSIEGSNINIWSTDKDNIGEKVYKFRRGRNQTGIHCLSFSQNSKYLALSSTSGTFHLFDISGNKSVSVNSFIYFRQIFIQSLKHLQQSIYNSFLNVQQTEIQSMRSFFQLSFSYKDFSYVLIDDDKEIITLLLDNGTIMVYKFKQNKERKLKEYKCCD